MDIRIETGLSPSIICDPNKNDLLHIFGEAYDYRHYTLNIKNGDTNTLHTFETRYMFRGSGIVFIESKKEFLLFHGNIPIHSYNLISKRWTDTNIEMPKDAKVEDFGYVTTKNGKYVLIIGGMFCGTDKKSDKILIYDIRNSKYIKSVIKCPKCHTTNAVYTNNGNIHLFQWGSGSHYKMNINPILHNANIGLDTYKKCNETNINNTKTEQFQTEQKQENTAKMPLQNKESKTKFEQLSEINIVNKSNDINKNVTNWICQVCSFYNNDSDDKCEMCQTGTNPNNINNNNEMEQKWNELKLENENVRVVMNEVKDWLTNTVELPQYFANFEEQGWDRMLQTIDGVDNEELIDMGIDKKGHRNRIMHFIKIEKEKQQKHKKNKMDSTHVKQAHSQDLNKFDEQIEGAKECDITAIIPI